MKKIGIFALILLFGCTSNPNDIYSKEKVYPYLYFINGYGYATFERYMWDEGFPDTIIVEFTRNGNFERYVKAERGGILKDSLGVDYSPAYYYRDVVGHTWVYDLRGKFIEFRESKFPHSTKNSESNYKP